MKRESWAHGAVLALLACTVGHSVHAASPTRDLKVAGAPVSPATPDPAIAKALATISTGEIEHTIRSLVAFHTRNTL